MRNALAAFLTVVLGPMAFGAAFGAQGDGRRPEPRRAATPELDLIPPGPWPRFVEDGVAPMAAESDPPTPSCGPGMLLVEGSYCTDVRQDCIRWLDEASLPFARCAEYRAPSRCVGKQVSLRFCIDQREYTPPGHSLPQNYASFEVASLTCASLGKRICTESEWNFACEGEEMRPYPYGFNRKPICNQDRSDLFENNPNMQVLRDLREPADARSECKSVFGVENMVGNMDEPVLREAAINNPPFRNALKGGWWMPARNRCRPATTAHDDFYKDIQVGVRCCDSAE